MKKGNVLQFSLTWGVISAIFFLIFSVIIYVANLQGSTAVSLINMALFGGVFVFVIKKFRDQEQEGYLLFGQGVAISAIMGVVISLLSSIYTYILMAFYDKGLIEKILIESENSMIDQGLDDAQIDAAMEMTAKFMTPGFITISAFFSTIIMAIVIGLIVSAILKKQPPVFSEKTEF